MDSSVLGTPVYCHFEFTFHVKKIQFEFDTGIYLSNSSIRSLLVVKGKCFNLEKRKKHELYKWQQYKTELIHF
jgi:hypothetical protein